MLVSTISTSVRKALLSQIVSKCYKFHLHSTPALSIKEIVIHEEGKNKIIESVIKESSRKEVLVKTPHDDHSCPVCRLNMDIKHTDVLILSQFVRKDGCMLPRRITGLCRLSQKRMSALVSMAHIAGLMPNLVPSYSKPNCQKRRRDWKKYNTYFEEKTIRFTDKFYRDSEEKVKYFEKLGITWNREPWKNRYQVNVQTQKIKFY